MSDVKPLPERTLNAAVAILTNAGFSIEGIAHKKERNDYMWVNAVNDATAVLRYAAATPTATGPSEREAVLEEADWSEETAWLIEFPGRNNAWYGFTDEGVFGITDNPNDVIRFARQCDAEAVARDIGWNDYIVTDHMWSGPVNEPVSTEHQWWDWHGLECCKVCGIVRRADDKNSPCKGPTRIVLKRTPSGPSDTPEGGG